MRPRTTAPSRASAICEDGGFTLVEVMISVSLMLIVLAAAWLFAGAMQKGQAVSDRESALANSMATPLARMQEIVLQNSAIDMNPAPTHYLLAVRTDQNLDDVLEQHTFTAIGPTGGTNKNTITEVAYRLLSSGARNGTPFVNTVIGRDNSNVSGSSPLFRYYDKNQAEITDMGLVPQNTKYVRISIRATVAGRTVTDSSTVQFRNRD